MPPNHEPTLPQKPCGGVVVGVAVAVLTMTANDSPGLTMRKSVRMTASVPDAVESWAIDCDNPLPGP